MSARAQERRLRSRSAVSRGEALSTLVVFFHRASRVRRPGRTRGKGRALTTVRVAREPAVATVDLDLLTHCLLIHVWYTTRMYEIEGAVLYSLCGGERRVGGNDRTRRDVVSRDRALG